MKASFRVSRNIFQNDENLTFRRPSPFLSKQNKNKNFEKDFKGPQITQAQRVSEYDITKNPKKIQSLKNT